LEVSSKCKEMTSFCVFSLNWNYLKCSTHYASQFMNYELLEKCSTQILQFASTISSESCLKEQLKRFKVKKCICDENTFRTVPTAKMNQTNFVPY
jgi:hypothetical protein